MLDRDTARARMILLITRFLESYVLHLTDEDRQLLEAERKIIISDDSYVDRLVELAKTLMP